MVEEKERSHGDAVNEGLNHASGMYFKVVDSDDWVEETALEKISGCIEGMVSAGKSDGHAHL